MTPPVTPSATVGSVAGSFAEILANRVEPMVVASVMRPFFVIICQSFPHDYSPPPMKPLRLFLMLSALLGFFAKLSAESLKVGDAAPVVSAVTDSGTTLNLGDVYAKNTYTVVWFYPKALTGGCTKQGCSLRDASAELTKRGAAVVGVSTDPVEKQKEFKQTNNFPFPLLADTDKKVVTAFGQPGLVMAARECYVIKDGKIVYKDAGVTDKQADNVLAFLDSDKKS